MKTTLLFLALLLTGALPPAQAVEPNSPINPADYAAPVKVACVGDSITAGLYINVSVDCFPQQLQRMLGSQWVVGNYGNSGKTLMTGTITGGDSYQATREFTNAKNSNPDVVIIMLGTNDTKYWASKSSFIPDYKNMIGQFKALPSHPRIFICRPPYVPGTGNLGITQPPLDEQMPMLESIARDESVGLIDNQSIFFGHEELFASDKIHPIVPGAFAIAKAIYSALTGSSFTGSLDPYLRSSWNGYQQLQFNYNNSLATVVLPTTPAAGHPWIWRPGSFGNDGQLDQGLVAAGWAVANLSGITGYGEPASLDKADQFIAYVSGTFQLSTRLAIEAYSGGDGLVGMNWAARHPSQVSSMYLDSAVMDFKSWPAGQPIYANFTGTGSSTDWPKVKTAYGFASDAAAAAYTTNPVDNLQPLANAHIGLFCVYGTANTREPPQENAVLVQTRYQALGGDIQVIPIAGRTYTVRGLTGTNLTTAINFILGHN